MFAFCYCFHFIIIKLFFFFCLLSTLTSVFPGASGLKYRNPETNGIRAIRLVDGKLQPPESGWRSNSVYYCVFPKGNSVHD